MLDRRREQLHILESCCGEAAPRIGAAAATGGCFARIGNSADAEVFAPVLVRRRLVTSAPPLLVRAPRLTYFIVVTQ